MPQVPVNPIPYEILRRKDGALAISANAGLITFEPALVRIEGADIKVCGKLPVQQVRIVNPGEDVLSYVQSEGALRFFQFASFGMTGSHILPLQE